MFNEEKNVVAHYSCCDILPCSHAEYMLYTKTGFGFLLTVFAYLLNMNNCIYISGQKWKNESLQYF